MARTRKHQGRSTLKLAMIIGWSWGLIAVVINLLSINIDSFALVIQGSLFWSLINLPSDVSAAVVFFPLSFIQPLFIPGTYVGTWHIVLVSLLTIVTGTTIGWGAGRLYHRVTFRKTGRPVKRRRVEASATANANAKIDNNVSANANANAKIDDVSASTSKGAKTSAGAGESERTAAHATAHAGAGARGNAEASTSTRLSFFDDIDFDDGDYGRPLDDQSMYTHSDEDIDDRIAETARKRDND